MSTRKPKAVAGLVHGSSLIIVLDNGAVWSRPLTNPRGAWTELPAVPGTAADGGA